ncbi:galectin-3-binding protein [Pogona vitticeps]
MKQNRNLSVSPLFLLEEQLQNLIPTITLSRSSSGPMMHLVASIFHGCLHRATFCLLMLCILLSCTAPSQALYNGAVRLANGNSLNEGRVEVYFDGQWGTVCDDNWDITDASVVCRSLGFEKAEEAKTSAAYGEGSGPILLDDVSCVGTEMHLGQCSSPGWLNHNCGHGEDAGVVCYNNPDFNPGKFLLDHSGSFSEDLSKLYDSQQDCDLNIIVLVAENNTEYKRLCAHRLILRASSEASFLLQKGNDSWILQVEEECLPNVNNFLRYFYTRQLNITVDSVKCFHKLASVYHVPRLRAYCTQVFPALIPLDPSFRVQLELYDYSLASGDAQLQDVILQYLAWNFDALTHTEAWKALTPDKMEGLLSCTELVTESEWSLLRALDHWAQNQTNVTMEGFVENIHFPMLFPEQLFEFQFSLNLYMDYKNIFQRKIMEAFEFHTVPFKSLEQYKLHELRGVPYTPRFYTGLSWSWHLDNILLTQQSTSSDYSTATPSLSFRTMKHPSFLFKDQNVSWSVQKGPTDGFSSSDSFPLFHLEQRDSSDDTIQYENKVLVLCKGFYVTNVLDFINGTAVVPDAAPAASFPCPSSHSSFIVVIRPSYKLNA